MYSTQQVVVLKYHVGASELRIDPHIECAGAKRHVTRMDDQSNPRASIAQLAPGVVSRGGVATGRAHKEVWRRRASCGAVDMVRHL